MTAINLDNDTVGCCHVLDDSSHFFLPAGADFDGILKAIGSLPGLHGLIYLSMVMSTTMQF